MDGKILYFLHISKIFSDSSLLKKNNFEIIPVSIINIQLCEKIDTGFVFQCSTTVLITQQLLINLNKLEWPFYITKTVKHLFKTSSMQIFTYSS